MKRSMKSLMGFSLKETDGELGKMEDFYFDDQSWTVRYLIIKTGSWLSNKKVLISPKTIQQTDWKDGAFLVNLTRDQIEKSPDVDTEEPVSRQQEELLSSYYQWDNYWGDEAHGGGIFGMMPDELYDEDDDPENISQTSDSSIKNTKKEDQHLRSAQRVMGYKIHATNGEIGEVSDYIIDGASWKIKFLVVDTGNWLNKRKVLLATKWIKDVNWENSVVIVDITTDAVQDSPEYNESEAVNDDYEKKLYDHYGRTSE